jgi:hypothetical protein
MTTIRKGGWRSTQRSKLSASRGPHKSNPKDFYYDAQTAPARLAEATSYAGEVPDVLTRETELERVRHLAGQEGISWTTGAGRNFTKEYWNPLIGLWVGMHGLDFALDLLLQGTDEPRESDFMKNGTIAPWIGMRRYLFAATEEDYVAAKARAEPVFEGLFAYVYERGSADTHYAKEACEAIAFAFSRGTSEWADRCLEIGFDPKAANWADYEVLVGATLDPGLALRAYTERPKYAKLYYVFDMVESLGGEAIPAFDVIEPYDAPARKRLAQARAVAEKVAAL